MANKPLTVCIMFALVILTLAIIPQQAKAIPTISQANHSPKYPQIGDMINITVKVEDPSSTITSVDLFYCSIPGGVCDWYPSINGPDVNNIYNKTVGLFANSYGADYYFIATNAAMEVKQSDTYYIQYALNITQTLVADRSDVFPGQNFNLTVNALYYANASAPVEYSDVNITRVGSSEYWLGTTDEEGNFTIEISAPATIGTYIYNATVTNRSLSNYSETSVLVLIEPLPDLRVGVNDIVYSPLSPTVDDTITANITVRNIGTLNATFYVLVTLFGGGSIQTLSNTSVTVNSGNLTIISVSWTAFEGYQYLNVTLDPGNFVREADEGNNFASKTITGESKAVDLEINYTLYIIIIVVIIILIILAVLLLSRRKSKQPPQE